LKLTTSHYYLPKGRCVHRLPDAELWGVDPDIEEDLDTERLVELRDVMTELTLQPLNGARKNGPEESTTPDEAAAADAPQDTPDPAALAEKLMGVDTQLAQAVKQCKGLLRAQPTLKGLAETLTNNQNEPAPPASPIAEPVPSN
jgi:hypothetical protein